MPRTPIEEMTPEELTSFAKEVVVRKLSERAHSRSDLAQALAKKQVPEGVVEATLAKFEAAGLIDDEDFARSFLRDNPDLANEFEKTILEMLGIGPNVDAHSDGFVADGPVDPDGIDF